MQPLHLQLSLHWGVQKSIFLTRGYQSLTKTTKITKEYQGVLRIIRDYLGLSGITRDYHRLSGITMGLTGITVGLPWDCHEIARILSDITTGLITRVRVHGIRNNNRIKEQILYKLRPQSRQTPLGYFSKKCGSISFKKPHEIHKFH